MWAERLSGSINPEQTSDLGLLVVERAKEEARNYNNNYVGTEHLLLAMLKEDLTKLMLQDLGINSSQVISVLEFIMGRGEKEVSGAILLTPRSMRVFKLSEEMAAQRGSNKIMVGDLFGGLLREGEGIAAGILESLDCTYEKFEKTDAHSKMVSFEEAVRKEEVAAALAEINLNQIKKEQGLPAWAQAAGKAYMDSVIALEADPEGALSVVHKYSGILEDIKQSPSLSSQFILGMTTALSESKTLDDK